MPDEWEKRIHKANRVHGVKGRRTGRAAMMPVGGGREVFVKDRREEGLNDSIDSLYFIAVRG